MAGSFGGAVAVFNCSKSHEIEQQDMKSGKE